MKKMITRRQFMAAAGVVAAASALTACGGDHCYKLCII